MGCGFLLNGVRERIMDVKNYNFYTVFSWMTTVLKLSGNELAVFAIIYSFSQDGKSEFKGSLNYLRKFTNTSKQTVITLLDVSIMTVRYRVMHIEQTWIFWLS